MTTSGPDNQPSSGSESASIAAPVNRLPNWEFVTRRPAHFIAFGGGAGLSRVAPINFLLCIGLFFLIGIWACSVTGKALGSHDHGGMVWDEIVAFLLVLLFTPNNLIWQAFAFLLFRLFDIFKPQPIRYYDRKLRGGFGVMFDDLLAAAFTLLCLAAWKAFSPF